MGRDMGKRTTSPPTLAGVGGAPQRCARGRRAILVLLAVSIGGVLGFAPAARHACYPCRNALRLRRNAVRSHERRRPQLLAARAQNGDPRAARTHDSWALLLRHHANVEWHGVRSEYRLENPVVLRSHHGRPGKRIRVLDADNHGTLISTLRPSREASTMESRDMGASGWSGCTWEEEEEYQLQHARPEDSKFPAPDLPPPSHVVRKTPGADTGAVVCVEEACCRSWLSPSAFGGPTLSIEFALRFGDWRARTEIRYHRGWLVSAVCTWEKSGSMPSHLSDTTYKDVDSTGPEGQDVVIYNDWHGVGFGCVENESQQQVLSCEPHLAVWTGFSDVPDALVRSKASRASQRGGQAPGAGARTGGDGYACMHAVRGEELFLLPQGAWVRCPQQVDIVKVANRGGAGEEAQVGDVGGALEAPPGEVAISAGWILWDQEQVHESMLARLTANVAANDIAVLTQDGKRECHGREMRPVARLALEKFWYREQPDYGEWFDEREYAKRAEEAELLAIRRRLASMYGDVAADDGGPRSLASARQKITELEGLREEDRSRIQELEMMLERERTRRRERAEGDEGRDGGGGADRRGKD